MELKPGYKQTEVGVIPMDWDSLPLGSVVDFLDGRRRPVKDSDRSKMRGEIPYYGASGIVDYVDGYLFDENLILLGEDGENILSRNTRLAFKISGKAWVNNHAHVLRPKDDVALDYLVEYLESLDYSQYNTGTAQPKLNKQVCSQILVAVPPLPEQSAIAAALSDVDALLSALDARIAKQRDLKTAAKQQVLTGKTRLPGFDGEWEVKRLSELCSLKSGEGITAERIDTHSEFPCYGGNGLRGYTKTFTHEGDYALIGRQGALCGNVVSASGKFFASEHALVVTPKSNADIYWLAFVLADANLNQYSESSAQPGLSAKKLLALEFNTPPTREEQIAIAKALSDMDAQLLALERQREKKALLKQGMMQELLTGKTRLVGSVAQPASNVVPFPKQEAKSADRRANVHFQRSVFAAEIVERLHAEPTFGHVKFQKLIYLAEHMCKVDIGANYHRDAAGPYDNQALRSVDNQLKNSKWFEARKLDGRYQYVPLEKHGGHKQYFDRYFAGVGTTFDDVIDAFKTASTEQCEIVATLYSAWDDLLKQGQPASDQAIVDQVLNHWHDAKKRIEADRWHKALDWMREMGFVPEGAASE